MTTPKKKPTTRSANQATSILFDEVWSRLREVVAFFTGIGIMLFETLGDKGDRPWLYAAAIGMMGLPLAGYLEKTLGKFGGSGPMDLPPDRPHPRPRSRKVEASE